MERPSESLTAFEKYQELNMNQVAKLIGVTSRQSVWRYIKEGKIPKPRYLVANKPLWRLGEVLDHTHSHLKTFDETDHTFTSSVTAEVKAKSIKKKTLVNELRKRLGIK